MAMITLVITSCARPDLLKKTIESFKKHNTYAVEKVIGIEDGESEECAKIIENSFQDAKVILNKKNKGQIESIDIAYSLVDTPYIFHMEDDWEFVNGGFIEKSLRILKADRKILQVWLRGMEYAPRHPEERPRILVGGERCYKLKTKYRGIWHGFSFNPGLRRTMDYKAIKSYGSVTKFDKERASESERLIGEIYFKNKFRAVVLPETYVRHIGEGRHVIFK